MQEGVSIVVQTMLQLSAGALRGLGLAGSGADVGTVPGRNILVSGCGTSEHLTNSNFSQAFRTLVSVL